MEKFAIIKTGGKQYQVQEGLELRVEKLEHEPGKSVTFDEVLLTFNKGELTIGTPHVEHMKVEAEVVKHIKGEKLIVFKYKPKKHERKKKGHRQPYTLVKITKIGDKIEKQEKGEQVKKVIRKQPAKKSKTI